MDWKTPIHSVPMIGPVYLKRLTKLEITTVGDLLLHVPFRYEDYSLISPIVQLQEGETVTVRATLEELKNTYLRNRKVVQKAILTDPSGSIEAIWYNQPYLASSFKPGDIVSVSGKVTRFGSKLTFNFPEIEVVRPGKMLIHTGRLVAIYPETAGISSKWLRSRIAYLLTYPQLLYEYLPEVISQKNKLPSLAEALKTIHFPSSEQAAHSARRRLAFDELLLTQMVSVIRRKQWQESRLTHAFQIKQQQINKFIASLPFTLTNSQQKVIAAMMHDLEKSMPMNRLVQGDVGSGKTVVAAVALYIAYLNGFQSLVMAPTEILAQQHLTTLSALLGNFGIRVGIKTSTHKLKSNDYDVYVGTHALITGDFDFPRIGLIIIDEQHRFGVKQRFLLRQQGNTPHVLTMTATPIPRTMGLTLYGDLDLSTIDEMPKGRIPIKTWVVPPVKRAAAYKWIKEQIKAPGKRCQVFIVCPFIEPSETMQTIKSATVEYERLQNQVFPDLKLGLLHGKLKTKDKDRLLAEFKSGVFDILVCTPVVEVGIDIPTATVMVIEAAERFGLSQLHQLRGRVGRGNEQSYCLLFSENPSQSSLKRLKYMEKTARGAELAQLDYQLRGPGERFGIQQHGRGSLKIASFADFELITRAGEAAHEVFSVADGLDRYPLLKERVISSTISEVAPD